MPKITFYDQATKRVGSKINPSYAPTILSTIGHTKSLQVDHPDGRGACSRGSMGNGGVMTCVQPWVSDCVVKLFLQATPHSFKHLQRAQSRAVAFASRRLYSRNDRLRNSVSPAPFHMELRNRLRNFCRVVLLRKSQVENRLWNSY